MRVLPRFYIRTALIWMLLAFLLGLLLVLDEHAGLELGAAALLPVFYHMLMVGWVTQLIWGVALWLFPIARRDQPQGNPRLGWSIYGCLNLGLLLRLAGEPLLGRLEGSLASWLLACSALLQFLAVCLFVWSIWPRVKTRASAPVRQPSARRQPEEP